MIVNNSGDSTLCHFHLNFQTLTKKSTVDIGYDFLDVYDPVTDKQKHYSAKDISYFEFIKDDKIYKYFTVPVPGIGSKTYPYFGEVQEDGNYTLLKVTYPYGTTSSKSFISFENDGSINLSIAGKTVTYHYIKNQLNEFIMAKKLINNKSRDKFSITCPEMEERFRTNFYSIDERVKVVQDLNATCLE